MRESLLHFVWQFQKFAKTDLTTTEGLSIKVLKTGYHNDDSGPDFSESRIEIGDLLWVGHVEIHIRSSDWNRHRHQHDQAYNSVILHVVWEHDHEVKNLEGNALPTIELRDRIAPELIKRNDFLMNSPNAIPCHTQICSVKTPVIIAMMEYAAIYRLEHKSDQVLALLESNRGSWEETAFQILARNFGFKVNAEPFEKLSRSILHKILVKHSSNLNQVEALLFGTAGFLPQDSEDEYVRGLIREYQFLCKKYGLCEKKMLRVEWKFLRMRPGNFPTVRLSQLASFISNHAKFFERFIHFDELKELFVMFKSEVSPYWTAHYDFYKPYSVPNHAIGRNSVEVILINTIAPILAAYSRQVKNIHYMRKAMNILESIKAERNKIIDLWAKIDIEPRSALESQALISLHNDFCSKKRCISCKVGASLLVR